MKIFYLVTSILFSFLILILAVENLAAKTQSFLLLFFSADAIGAFLLVLAIAFLGAVMGVFFTGLVLQLLKKAPDEDEI